jgi:NHLM bacteriocin system ABC transporter peptidase/ATP-binding protein
MQMEAVECGAAALGMVLGYYGRFVPLEELRAACGVSRDGAKASHVLAVARSHGLVAQGFRMEAQRIADVRKPAIIYWAFSHFLVVEGVRKRFGKTRVAVNDPARGPRYIDWAEFDSGFTGVVLTFKPGPQFRRGGHRTTVAEALLARRQPTGSAAALVLLASLLLVVPGLASPAFTRVFIDDILTGSAPGYLGPLLLAMITTVIVAAGLTLVQRHYMLRIEARMAGASGARFFRHLLRLPIEFFLHRQPAEVEGRLRANDTVAEILSRDLALNVVNLLLIGFYAALLIHIDVALGVIGLTMALLNVAALRLVARARTDAVQAASAERGKLNSATFNTIRLIETIKATGGEPDAFARWANSLAKVITARQRQGAPAAVVSALPALIAMVNTGLILLVGGLRVTEGALSLGLLIAFQSLLVSLTAPVTQLTTFGQRIQDMTADLTRLRDAEVSPEDQAFRIATPRLACSRLTGRLEFRNVTFGYNRQAEPFIRDLSFTIAAGRTVAIVGRSGSGKSTISKLAAGVHAPWSGQILLDGMPREEIPREVLADSVSYVAQEIYLFEDTVRNNLSLWDDSVPDDAIAAALRGAALYDDIRQRPGGIHSAVSEAGRNFSGGQRQRLELARALVRDPALVILDEATSAVDPNVERQVVDGLRRRGCACLIMAHRVSTVRGADEIIVVSDGVAVDRGTHAELLARDGPYADLIGPGIGSGAAT